MEKIGKIIKYALKTLFWLFIITVNAIILWRVFFSGDPSDIKKLAVNENLAAAYEENGDLTLVRQKQRTITSSGLFSVTDALYIPEAKQVQIVVRYNNSTLRHLKEDFSLDDVPDREDDVFDVTLVKTIDLTPENTEDNADENALREERFAPSEVKKEYKRLYSYRRFVFDDVTYDDAVGVFVDIYYNGACDYGETPYGALCIYDAEADVTESRLGKSERRTLDAEKGK